MMKSNLSMKIKMRSLIFPPFQLWISNKFLKSSQIIKKKIKKNIKTIQKKKVKNRKKKKKNQKVSMILKRNKRQ
jgi:hypothetical protein